MPGSPKQPNIAEVHKKIYMEANGLTEAQYVEGVSQTLEELGDAPDWIRSCVSASFGIAAVSNVERRNTTGLEDHSSTGELPVVVDGKSAGSLSAGKNRSSRQKTR